MGYDERKVENWFKRNWVLVAVMTVIVLVLVLSNAG